MANRPITRTKELNVFLDEELTRSNKAMAAMIQVQEDDLCTIIIHVLRVSDKTTRRGTAVSMVVSSDAGGRSMLLDILRQAYEQIEGGY